MTNNVNIIQDDPFLNTVLNRESQAPRSIPYAAFAQQEGIFTGEAQERDMHTVTPETYKAAGKPDKQHTLPYHDVDNLANFKERRLLCLTND